MWDLHSVQGYENLFIKYAYEHIAQKMDQISEAYPSGRLYGRANMSSYQEKKTVSALPSLVHMPCEIVPLPKMKDCLCIGKSISILFLWGDCYFYFHEQNYLNTRGFGCCTITQKFLKLLWLFGFHGQSSHQWREMIQNSFCGAALVVGTSSVAKTSRPAAGQAGERVRSCAKLIKQKEKI